MPLRIRLSLIISTLFLVGMLAGISLLIASARVRVLEEVESTATLTFQLLEAVLSEPTSFSEQNNATLLDRLRRVDEARHMEISIESPGTQRQNPPEITGINAPAWFVGQVMPPPLEYRKPLGEDGDIILIRTNPADEINEVWQDSRNFMLVLLLVLLIINGILYFTIGRWFKPVQAIVTGLEEVEKGNYSGQQVDSSLPELGIIMEKLNHLTMVLRESKKENDRLTKRSLSIQEEERRHLSRELHDELGQSISAVKAIAFSIAERTSKLDSMSAEGATKIVNVTNHVRNHIRSMMGKLRPSMLDEFGLVSALEQMIDEWNDHHKNMFCSLKTGQGVDLTDSSASINVYRIIQESLTNVASHAEADHVEVRLDREQDYALVISDNGRGFDAGSVNLSGNNVDNDSDNDSDNNIANRGMGLTSIRERVNALGGTFAIDSGPETGTTLTIHFPAPETEHGNEDSLLRP